METSLEKIFSKLDCDYEYIKQHPNESLLNYRIGLVARDLLILYFEIKRNCDVDIPKEMILNGEFSTYAGIRKIINTSVILQNESD